MGTSPKMILDASETGQGSFYHHFAGKAELAHEVLSGVSDEMQEAAASLLGGKGSPLARIKRYLSAPRDGTKGCRMGRFASEPTIGDERLRGPVNDYFKHVQVLVEQCLQQAVEQGELPSTLDPRKVSETIIATVQGGYVLSRAYGDPGAMKRATGGARLLLEQLARK
jgi:AcrR family transcriptional regulator